MLSGRMNFLAMSECCEMPNHIACNANTVIPAINPKMFAPIAGVIFLESVKEYATLPARAHIDYGVKDKTKVDHRN